MPRGWRRTGSDGVQHDLAFRDAHAPGAEIAEAEDALAICHYRHVDVLLSMCLELGKDAALVFVRDVQAPGLQRQRVVLLARLADGGRVDEGQQFVRVCDEQCEEGIGVAGLQVAEEDVLVDRLRHCPEVAQRLIGIGNCTRDGVGEL